MHIVALLALYIKLCMLATQRKPLLMSEGPIGSDQRERVPSSESFHDALLQYAPLIREVLSVPNARSRVSLRQLFARDPVAV